VIYLAGLVGMAFGAICISSVFTTLACRLLRREISDDARARFMLFGATVGCGLFILGYLAIFER